MKRLLTYLFLVAPIYVMAQAKTVGSANAQTKVNGDMPVMVDGVLTTIKAAEASVKPEEIYEVSIKKYEAADKHMLHDSDKVNMFITTQNYAIKHYQYKLASVSAEARKWLSANADDRFYRYFIDGEELPKTKRGISRLYELKREAIESVVVERDLTITDDRAAKIKILTGKKINPLTEN